MTKGRIIILFFLALSCMAVGSCSTERDPCLQPQNVFLRMQFLRKAADTGTAFVDTLLPYMLLNPIDHPLPYMAAGVQKVSAFNIRLNPGVDSSRWYLQTDSAEVHRRDTLTFYYERQLHFISNACGYTYYYRLNDVRAVRRTLADTLHSIDSVVITQREVNNEAGKTHVNIYFHRN
jgi:hypothetical protein